MRFNLMSTFLRVIRRLVHLVANDDVLVDELRSLAKTFLDSTQISEEEGDRAGVDEATSEPTSDRGETVEVSMEPASSSCDDGPSPNLLRLAEQCRVKAEGARWAAETPGR